MNKSTKLSRGLAQIPLLIILLLMAVSIPIASKLAENSVDNRNLAAGSECDDLGNPRARQVCRATTVVKTNTSSNTSGGGGGECSHDIDCGSAADCAYCSAGRCISGCTVGKPTFGKTSGTVVNVVPTIGASSPGSPNESAPTGIPISTTITSFKNTVVYKDCLRSIGVAECDKQFDALGIILFTARVPTSSTLNPNILPGEYNDCLLRSSGDATAADRVNYCNSQLSIIPTTSGGNIGTDTNSPGSSPSSTTGGTTKKTGSSSGNNTPVSNSGCTEQCPGTDGVLRNCTGTTVGQSLCNVADRAEMCGNSCFVCPSVGGSWSKQTDLTKCSAAAGTGPILNYKISFGGVIPSSSQCLVSWPLKFYVLGSGESKTYTGVLPESVATVNNKLVFSGSLTLGGFSKTSGVSAFISGPKSLQMKYGINNQTTAYNKAGGELVLTTEKSTSPINDFSGYPLLPGDVTDTNLDVQDGWINGIDFSYVKSKSLVHETISPGGYLKGDLDGNCQVNSNDVNLLKISLQEKQGQLY